MSSKEQYSAVLIGGSPEVLSFYSRLKRPDRVQGVFCQFGLRLPEGLLRLGDVSEVADFLKKNVNIKRLYCGVNGVTLPEARAVQNACKARAVKFCAIMPLLNDLDADFVSVKVGKSTVLSPKSEPLTHLYNRIIKRLFDLFFVILFMLTFFPFVYILKAIIAKRKQRGSSFCTHVCVGPDSRPFKSVSFRGDKRSLARVFNVLIGHMSLVGPSCYDVPDGRGVDGLPQRLERRHVKPGMTSWAHVRKQETDADGRLMCDIWYVEHWSLWLDFTILFKSMFV